MKKAYTKIAAMVLTTVLAAGALTAQAFADTLTIEEIESIPEITSSTDISLIPDFENVEVVYETKPAMSAGRCDGNKSVY